MEVRKEITRIGNENARFPATGNMDRFQRDCTQFHLTNKCNWPYYRQLSGWSLSFYTYLPDQVALGLWCFSVVLHLEVERRSRGLDGMDNQAMLQAISSFESLCSSLASFLVRP